MKAALAHAATGFALVVALWSFDALPLPWSEQELGALQGRHAQENSILLARELS